MIYALAVDGMDAEGRAKFDEALFAEDRGNPDAVSQKVVDDEMALFNAARMRAQ